MLNLRSTGKRVLLLALGAASVAGLALAAGCSDDDAAVNPAPVPDSGHEASSTDSATPSDAGVDASAKVARGEYLVFHVAGCPSCHTPRLASGAPDMTKSLSGVDCLVDINGPADGGCLSSRNLTNDPTGLKNRTDQEIKTMFLEGKRPDGKFLSSFMPYYMFHNMTSDDADAIVAYLRTVPAVDHTIRPSEAPFDNIPAAAAPIDPQTIPSATDGGTAAERGRYLAAMVGACMECHTEDNAPGSAQALDMSKAFAGNKSFPAAAMHLPVPPFPDTIYTANLTSDPTTGLNGWTIDDVVRVLKQGKDRTDGGICPPMPTGPMGAFGGLTDDDARDIATYIIGLPPVNNAVTDGNGSCVAP